MSLGTFLAGFANAALPENWRLIQVSTATPAGSEPASGMERPAEPDAHLPPVIATPDVLPALASTMTCGAESQRYFPLDQGLGLTRLQDGHFLYVDPMDEAVAAHLIARGYWENWIHRVVCTLVQPGDHIIEVGANFGYYTVAMARQAGPDGSIPPQRRRRHHLDDAGSPGTGQRSGHRGDRNARFRRARRRALHPHGCRRV